MKTAKVFIMGCMAAVFALDCSASYAMEDDGTVFFSGRVGASDRIINCSGNCRADPSGTIEIGFSGDYQNDPDFGSLIFRLSPSLAYSRYKFDINGNVLNVVEKGIYLHLDTALRAHPRFIFVMKLGPTWKTANSLNTPGRTVFGVEGGLDFLYQVEPGLYALVGLSYPKISPANQPDFISYTVDFGLRWYLF